MKYRLSREVMKNDKMRSSFNALASRIFDLSFENWYQEGYWSDFNQPYTLFDGERAIANVSVNKMEILWQNQRKTYIQLGTVMTDEAYRGQGLSRFLMEEIKRDWESRCDACFLFANQTVLDFYPKFGFVKEKQYQYSAPICQAGAAGQKLDMNAPAHREILKHYYEKTNPFSKLQVIHNYGLLMFSCGFFMKECVYYSPEYDAVVIAEQDGSTLHCYDVFGGKGNHLIDILASIAPAGTDTAVLEFTPKDSRGFEVQFLDDEDDTLFVAGGKENIFAGRKLRFPAISHT